MMPKVTVVMPVYNGARYLAAAIQSILDQTWSDFELLIIEDGSTDQSPALIASFTDSRIRVLANGRNLGLVASLNVGLSQARGEYIARMDGDDVSFPHRLEKQVAYLDQHPDTGLCGTWFERHRDGVLEWGRPATEDADIRFSLLFKTTFLHSSVMLRRSVLVQHNLVYEYEYPYAEDYALWIRLSQYTQLANIPEFLVAYRYHPDNCSSRNRQTQKDSADRIVSGYLTLLDDRIDASELALHADLTRFRTQGTMETVLKAGAWLERLAQLVEARLNQPGCKVYELMQAQWYSACGKAAWVGFAVWRYYRQHPAGKKAAWHWYIRLGLRCGLKKAIPAASRR
ncbi:MAG: glycosyltransferase family 2 protein [Methylococcaceae bacterium]